MLLNNSRASNSLEIFMASKALAKGKLLHYMQGLQQQQKLIGQVAYLSSQSHRKDDNLFSSELLSRFFEYDRKTVVNFMLLEAFLSKTDKIDAEGIKTAYETFEPLAEKIANQYKANQESERERNQKDLLVKSTSIPMNVPSVASSPQMRIPTK